MAPYHVSVDIRFSDLDPNFHLRHSVYYDFGALCRMELLTRIGLSTKKLEELGIGPILFREEAIFRREIVFEDKIRITTEILTASEDYSRWSIRHEIRKGDDSLAATLQVDGAWIDMNKRKLAIPDDFVRNIFSQIPKSADFKFAPRK